MVDIVVENGPQEEGVAVAKDILLSYIRESASRRPKRLVVSLEDGEWVVTAPGLKPSIARIRRITGYLSNLDNFGSAKKAEEKARVAHV